MQTIFAYYFFMPSLPAKLLRNSFILLSLLATCSCTAWTYYRQSIAGQLEIMRKSRSIELLLEDQDTAPELRSKLRLAIALRRYASKVLHLPENDSYSSYVDLERPFVVWNVVATPEFSLQPLSWCYPVVGCLTYRGYFSRSAAASFAQDLRARGYDVHLAGVTAYSTLGWFADPIINTMLLHNDTFLARVIFHELAHQLLYFTDDTEFNEAFADTVAEYGVRRWLLDNNMQEELAAFEQTLAGEQEFNQLVFKYKAELEELYRLSLGESELRRRKQELYGQMVHDYERLHPSWPGAEDYAAWFHTDMNNAKLALVLTYKDLVPAFTARLARVDYDLQQFYRSVSRLRDCDNATRRQFMASQLPDPDC